MALPRRSVVLAKYDDNDDNNTSSQIPYRTISTTQVVATISSEGYHFLRYLCNPLLTPVLSAFLIWPLRTPALLAYRASCTLAPSVSLAEKCEQPAFPPPLPKAVPFFL
jgi:hypothetical protein